MVNVELVLADRGSNSCFIPSYVIGKYVTPGIVRIVLDVAIGALDNTRRADGTNVMAFAVIVPADNLDMCVSILWRINERKMSNLNKFRLNLSRLLPAG